LSRTLQRGTGALIATLVAALLALSTATPALAAPDHRDDFALGRYVDHSDFGDWSSVLTQSLGVLALHRAPDVAPSDAAVGLLLAQQCDDGAFPHQFRAPSTADPAPCVGNVDTTSFAVQALDAVGEDDAVVAAAAWLADLQDEDDGSFGGEDGVNTTSTGLAALALELGGFTEEAQHARDWVLALQDGCDVETAGAIPFQPADADEDPDGDGRGVEVMSTSQALLGLAGSGIGAIDGTTAATDDPTTGCTDEPEDELGDPAEAAAAYLVSQLVEGTHLMIQGFASEGATIDVLFALAAVEAGGDTLAAIRGWLDGRVGDYTQGAAFDAEGSVYAGPTAKLALAAIVAGDDPRNVGDTDLVAQLQSVEVTELSEVSVSCDADEVAPGDIVDCTIVGLLGGETVDVLVELNPTLLDEPVTADSGGVAEFAFTIPGDASDGATVTITVAGLGVAELAEMGLMVVAAEEEVEEDTDGSEESEESEDLDQVGTTDDADEDVLPETGDHLVLTSGIGVFSLLLGLGLVAVGRRRQVAHV
jgi:LPXTG-motif cell wall-anchored protein